MDWEGYIVRIKQQGSDDVPEVCLEASNYLSARWKAWRYGRLYAETAGESQLVLIEHRYLRTEGSNRPKWWGVISVRKVVSLWFD
jgi:hypothetical protein